MRRWMIGLMVMGLASAVIAQSLPMGAKSAENLYKSKVKQADAVRSRNVRVAKTQLVAVLNGELKKALKAGNLNGANAIKAKIDEYNAPATAPSSDVPLTKKQLVGTKWKASAAPGRYSEVDFITVTAQFKGYPGGRTSRSKWHLTNGQVSWYVEGAGYGVAQLFDKKGTGFWIHPDGREVPWTWKRVK